MDDDSNVGRMRWGEVAFGSLILAVFAGTIWFAPANPPEARQFPVLVAGFGICLAVVLAIQQWRERRAPLPREEGVAFGARKLYGILLTLSYVTLLSTGYVGFVTATIAFVVSLGFALSAHRTFIGLVPLFFAALVVASAVYIGFGMLLGIPLPSGTLLP